MQTSLIYKHQYIDNSYIATDFMNFYLDKKYDNLQNAIEENATLFFFFIAYGYSKNKYINQV
jgi:hypothetical protein